MSHEILLEIKDLKTSFFTGQGEVQALRGASFRLRKGDVLGVVGESGSGKSVTSLSIMGLIENPGRIKSGQIIFKGMNLATMGQRELSNIRGNEISMIFQEPMTSLNPVYSIRNQLVEVIRRHQKVGGKEALARAIEMLELVGIPDPQRRINSYPHEFSGGMRQRVMIATALSCNPSLLIADEPTTALDVTIQAQILDLMTGLKDKFDMSIIFITHDLGVIAEICNHIVVMYGGVIMEQGSERDIFYNPQNPYTVGLHKSVPSINEAGDRERLVPIEGTPPDLMFPPVGCAFSPRCPHAMEICLKRQPPTFKIGENHSSACWLLHEEAPQVSGFQKAGKIIE